MTEHRDDTDNPAPEQPQESEREGVKVPASDDAGTTPTVKVEVSGVSEERQQFKEQEPSLPRERTRRGLALAFFLMFFAVFGVGAVAAPMSGKPRENAFELVKFTLPFVTGFGGYILGHYFPAQNTPRGPSSGGPGDPQG